MQRQLVETVANRAAELLQTTVVVIDVQGRVIARGPGASRDLPAAALADPSFDAYIRVPLPFEPAGGAVLIARPGDPAELSPRLARVIVELVIAQAVVAHRLPNQHTLKNKFLHDILHGLVTEEQTLLREARLLGIDLVPPRAVLLIDAADFIADQASADQPSPALGASSERQVRVLIDSIVNFFHLPNDAICAYLGDGAIAVLKASNTRNLELWVGDNPLQEGGNTSWANLDALKRASQALLVRLRADTGGAIGIGVGRYHPGLRGLARSYQDARVALSLGRQLHGPNAVYCLDQLGMAAFVGIEDEHTKRELALHLLGPLDHEPELIATLERFFAENCNPGPTARHLGIHRNTVAYRLEKIASLSGLDPRRFDDAVQIRLALLVRTLHEGRGES